MGMFGVGQSTARVIKKEDIKTKFKDVAGCEEVEFVYWIRPAHSISPCNLGED
jgi:hypothetical protein